MPADYSSTVQALSLPVSPPRSPSSSFQPIRPPWTRRSASSQRRTASPFANGRTNYRDKMIDSAEKIHRRVMKTVKKMTILQRWLAGTALLVFFVLGILFLVFNSRIFGWLEPYAEKWKKTKGGWLILWGLTFTTAFPPIIGYSSCLTIAGFVYGFPEGRVSLFKCEGETTADRLTGGLLQRQLPSSDHFVPSSFRERFSRDTFTD
jgi:hypothetical protein